jgi:hypothetical protein
MKTSFVEELKIVSAIKPQAGAAITGDYISMRDCGRVGVLVHINQAAANTVAITIEQAKTAAGGSSTALVKTVPIYANEDCDASDTMVKKTDAVSFTTSAAIKTKTVLFQIDSIDLTDGYDFITVKTGASNAGNITSAEYILSDLRYAQATPPSVIV